LGLLTHQDAEGIAWEAKVDQSRVRHNWSLVKVWKSNINPGTFIHPRWTMRDPDKVIYICHNTLEGRPEKFKAVHRPSSVRQGQRKSLHSDGCEAASRIAEWSVYLRIRSPAGVPSLRELALLGLLCTCLPRPKIGQHHLPLLKAHPLLCFIHILAASSLSPLPGHDGISCPLPLPVRMRPFSKAD